MLWVIIFDSTSSWIMDPILADIWSQMTTLNPGTELWNRSETFTPLSLLGNWKGKNCNWALHSEKDHTNHLKKIKVPETHLFKTGNLYVPHVVPLVFRPRFSKVLCAAPRAVTFPGAARGSATLPRGSVAWDAFFAGNVDQKRLASFDPNHPKLIKTMQFKLDKPCNWAKPENDEKISQHVKNPKGWPSRRRERCPVCFANFTGPQSITTGRLLEDFSGWAERNYPLLQNAPTRNRFDGSPESDLDLLAWSNWTTRRTSKQLCQVAPVACDFSLVFLIETACCHFPSLSFWHMCCLLVTCHVENDPELQSCTRSFLVRLWTNQLLRLFPTIWEWINTRKAWKSLNLDDFAANLFLVA